MIVVRGECVWVGFGMGSDGADDGDDDDGKRKEQRIENQNERQIIT